jgi:hypothetical protein
MGDWTPYLLSVRTIGVFYVLEYQVPTNKIYYRSRNKDFLVVRKIALAELGASAVSRIHSIVIVLVIVDP